jgi:hypothetical protein
MLKANRAAVDALKLEVAGTVARRLKGFPIHGVVAAHSHGGRAPKPVNFLAGGGHPIAD